MLPQGDLDMTTSVGRPLDSGFFTNLPIGEFFNANACWWALLGHGPLGCGGGPLVRGDFCPSSYPAESYH